MKKIISLSICLLSLVSYSQQTPQRNLYGYNKYAINPAYAGASGCTQINFLHKFSVNNMKIHDKTCFPKICQKYNEI